MKNRIDLTYFAYGNRDFECLKSQSKNVIPSSCVKSSASSILQRNYLDFDPGVVQNKYCSVKTSSENISSSNKKNNKYNCIRSSSEPNFEVNEEIFNRYHPEYKRYRNTNEQITALNNYLYPINQYLYKDNPKIKTVEKLFCLQKSKQNIAAAVEQDNNKNASRCSTNNDKNLKNKNNEKIILKNQTNNNVLIPNIFHLKNNNSFSELYNNKSENNIQNSDNYKLGSFLESKQSPDYLRNYDVENLKNIDQYYLNKKENLHVLSRFGNWITLKPNDKNRSHALEKRKHGTYETSIVAPVWMDIASRRDNKKEYNLSKKMFKCVQHNNTLKDKTKVTLLIDRDQKNVKPLFLRDTYEKNRILLNLKKNGKE
jgi:hypothetical protein